nr:hypothetical protein [Mycoavidus sp. B2-EB]
MIDMLLTSQSYLAVNPPPSYSEETRIEPGIPAYNATPLEGETALSSELPSQETPPHPPSATGTSRN